MFGSGHLLYVAWRDIPIVHLTEEEARAVAENLLKKVKAYGLVPRNPDIRIVFKSIGPGMTGFVERPTENGWVKGEEWYTIS